MPTLTESLQIQCRVLTGSTTGTFNEDLYKALAQLQVVSAPKQLSELIKGSGPGTLQGLLINGLS